MQTEIMNDYKSYKIRAIILYSSFQRSSFMVVAEFTIMASCNSLVKDIFYYNHIYPVLWVCKNWTHVTFGTWEHLMSCPGLLSSK